MKFILAILWWVAPVAGLLAAEDLTVAVYGFADADGSARGYGRKVTALVVADLTTETNLIMLERSQLNKALGEQALGHSGMVNSDSAAKIGQITGAKTLVSGQVIKNGDDSLVVIANIIGTETGRLFAVKVQGSKESLVELASDLSHKIAQKILEEAPCFVVKSKSHADYLDRMVKNVTGTNRPTVAVSIHWPQGPSRPCATANSEMGVILLKAGFPVVDGRSDRKPEVQITGIIDVGEGPRRGGLFSSRSHVDVKIQQRATGAIISFDSQTADAVDDSRIAADKLAEANAIDGLAERVVPLLAK